MSLSSFETVDKFEHLSDSFNSLLHLERISTSESHLYLCELIGLRFPKGHFFCELLRGVNFWISFARNLLQISFTTVQRHVTICQKHIPLVQISLNEKGSGEPIQTIRVLFGHESFLVGYCLNKVGPNGFNPQLKGISKGFPSNSRLRFWGIWGLLGSLKCQTHLLLSLKRIDRFLLLIILYGCLFYCICDKLREDQMLIRLVQSGINSCKNSKKSC